MKLVAEYLERAHQFERLSANETDPKLKADFTQQALAYHRLAEGRARETGLDFAEGKQPITRKQ